jgi:hypothetical protein
MALIKRIYTIDRPVRKRCFFFTVFGNLVFFSNVRGINLESYHEGGCSESIGKPGGR